MSVLNLQLPLVPLVKNAPYYSHLISN